MHVTMGRRAIWLWLTTSPQITAANFPVEGLGFGRVKLQPLPFYAFLGEAITIPSERNYFAYNVIIFSEFCSFHFIKSNKLLNFMEFVCQVHFSGNYPEIFYKYVFKHRSYISNYSFISHISRLKKWYSIILLVTFKKMQSKWIYVNLSYFSVFLFENY